MSNRETKKIILPVTQKEVEIYTYITGGEKRQINEILTANLSADVTGSAKGEIPLSVVYKANDKALELMVKLPIDEVNNLPSKDYDFLLNEVNQVTNDSSFSEKKTI
jgi:hypothetical protein